MNTETLPLFGDPVPTVRKVRVREHDRRVSGPVSAPLARTTDPETSREARPKDPDRTERLILGVLRDRGPLSDDELVRVLPMHYGPTIRTARSRLARAGYVEDTGERRASARNRRQIVWTVTPAGHQEVQRAQS